MQRQLKHVLAALMIGAVALGALPGIAHGQDMPSVKLGVQPWLGYGPWWIAAEKGFFEDRGLDVEVIDFTWDQDMNAALASGRIDVEAAATNTLIALINQDVDAQAFLLLDASFEADAIIANKDITSIEDLAGREVAYEPGSTSDLLLNYALSEAGLTIDDVIPVPIAASDAGAAVIAGQVDVAVTYEPYISAALSGRDDYGVLYSAAERPGLISDVMIAQRSFISENPDVIEALALAWDDAIAYLRENPDEGGQIIADAVGSDMEEFTVAFEGVQVFSLEENAVEFSGDFQETFATVGEIMMGLNPDEITVAPTPEDAFAVDYLDAYLPAEMPTPDATEAAS
ncbi:MAG TPA: MetQ/NlpA family ABC transporter substrate-binding protein [Aggregatilinea sp.]|uniref:ABC transporter substrate-binding protein n=1 Tax=Aggregatilinea sp. TaxID=2806333 RepID=UPI002C74D172|nr:ABC transporter substrate-binding protein [Aggregatilinea sp.]HML23262.1 MetQ/NlpA family ABC transporter substrate-binding protein [Aggregatilinea sp.]